MPKRVRPYGSAEDAEFAALSRGRPHAGDERASEAVSGLTAREIAAQAVAAVSALNDLTSGSPEFTTLDEVREIIAALERLGQDLPQLCEQMARILVIRREERQIAPGPGQNPDFWVGEAVEALDAAGQAADMMTAALTQAGRTSGELRPAT
jgi:hypothetical protein